MMVEDPSLHGAFNAVAPGHVTHRQMLAAISRAVSKPFFLPAVPKALIRMAMGEMALMLTEGSRVSAEKLEGAGFVFRYPRLNAALDSIV